MEAIYELIAFVPTNGPMILTNVIVILSAIIAIALVIPGEQPEKFLQRVLDFLKKWSKK